MEVFVTESICKRYRLQKVVDEVNITIQQGDIYGFIGENGAGKTTIIRLLTGLIKPSSGSFRLFGVSNKDPHFDEAKRQLAAIVENPSIYLSMSAYDNLKYQCTLFGVDYAKIAPTLELVGLDYLLDNPKKAANFSLGMRQRLAIGIALITDPHFIVLDEPMNGLDPEGIVEVRNLITKLNKEHGITFLISSHILGELARISTRYGFIHRGKLIKEMTSQELTEECKKSTLLVTDDLNKTSAVLDKLGYDYRIINNEFNIFNDVDITTLVLALHNDNVKIKKLTEQQNDIEDYYLKMMKGIRHA